MLSRERPLLRRASSFRSRAPSRGFARPRAAAPGAWVDLRIGLRFARRDPVASPAPPLHGARAGFGTPAVTLAPLYARAPPSRAAGLGGMLSAVGLGAVATALCSPGAATSAEGARGDRCRRRVRASRSPGLALSRRYAVSLASLALLGGAMMCSVLPHQHAHAEASPARLRGRVISLYALAWLGFVPLGNLQAGAVAQRFGASASLWAGAGGIAATLLAVQAIRPIPPAPPTSGDSLSRQWLLYRPANAKGGSRAAVSLAPPPLAAGASGQPEEPFRPKGSYDNSVHRFYPGPRRAPERRALRPLADLEIAWVSGVTEPPSTAASPPTRSFLPRTRPGFPPEADRVAPRLPGTRLRSSGRCGGDRFSSSSCSTSSPPPTRRKNSRPRASIGRCSSTGASAGRFPSRRRTLPQRRSRKRERDASRRPGRDSSRARPTI